MEQNEIDIAGHVVAIWCRDPEVREQIEAALAPLGLRLVAADTVADIVAAAPACAVFHLPLRKNEDPAFVDAWEQARAQSHILSIRTRVKPAGEPRLGSINRYSWLFDDAVNLPLDADVLEELAMRVRRNIQREIFKGRLPDLSVGS
ncbi:MAG TPA: hypothetical protein VGE07_10120 [Herpetosiphonaceae bacterium]